MKKAIICLSWFTILFILNGILSSETFEIKTGSAKNVTAERPLFGKINLEFNEHIIFQESDQDEHFIFRNVSDIALDSSGNIYLLDFQRILKYTAKGDFSAEIGKLGAGPGEHLNPRNLFIDPNDNLYINDAHKVILYDKNDKFVNNIPLNPPMISKVYVTTARSRRNIYGVKRKMSQAGPYKVLTVFNDGLKKGETIAKFPDREVHIRSKKGGSIMGGVSHLYSSNLLLTPLQPDRLCFAHNLDYNIYILDLKGTVRLIIKNKEKPHKITGEEMAAFKKRYGKQMMKILIFPSQRPFISKLLTDAKGRIYAFRKRSILDRGKNVKVDIYSKAGRFLYVAEFPYMPVLFGDGCFYAIDKNAQDDDKVSIKKITINNYKKLEN